MGLRQRGPSIHGHVLRHPDFPSRILRNRRDVVIYLPPSYGRTRHRRFPVLYAQDGQNVFDARTSAYGVEWGLDGHAQRLIRARTMEEIIIVGLYNTDARLAEYTPAWSEMPDTGRLDVYARFLLEEVKPFIDATYRTHVDAEHTGIMGSSLGGLSALYLSARHPDVFTRVAAVSPSLWFGKGAMLDWLARQATLPRRLWLCAGTEEGKTEGSARSHFIDNIRRLRSLLLRRGYREDATGEGPLLFYNEIEGGRHDERSWGARTDRILQSLYPRV